jgi:NAD(P)H-nitrite reductase large subunit
MEKREAYNLTKKELADNDGVLCYCKQVTERRIRKEVQNGKRRFVSVKQATDAGSGCGLCQPLVEDVIKNELSKK